jgi:hypothetical protein
LVGEVIEPQQQEQPAEEENRIYQTYDGLTSSYTRNTYRNTFNLIINATVKNDNSNIGFES